jgi:glycerol uptake facilitator-like aquaporin
MADQSNIERVQENVRKMQAQNAPQSDIVGYLKTEGYTPTRFEAAVASAKKVGGPPIDAGFGRSLLQGLTFNTADEIEAAMRALMSKGMSAFDAQQTLSGLVTGQAPQSQYEKELARVRAGIKQYEEQYPGRAFTGELVGGLLPTAAALIAAPFTGGATAPAAATGAARTAAALPTLGSMTLKGLGYGAASGAAAGAGGATGGPESRLMGGLVGAGFGGVLGAAAPTVTSAIGTGGRKILEATGMTQPVDAATKARELIAKKLAQEGISPDELAARQAGVVRTLGARDETLADIGGEAMRRLARGSMAIPQGAQTEVRQMLTERAAGAGPRITQDITDLTAIGARDIGDVAEEIIQRRKDAAAPLYKQAFEAGEVYSPRIDELLAKSKDIKTAIETARGLPQYADLPANSMLLLDKAYKYVGDMANEARKAGKGSRANDLDTLRMDLLNAISDQKTGVPVYRDAVNTFASESLLKDALELGSKNFLKKTPAEINREIKKFPGDAEQQMYRLGAVQSLRDEIYGMRETANIADKFLNSREMRDRMRTVFNSQGEYEAFIKNLERERQMAVTRSRIEGGSPTAPIQQDIAELQAQSPSEMLQAGAQMVGGNITGGAMNLMRQLGPRLQGMNENVAEQVARSVLDPRFMQQQEFLLGLTPLMDQLRQRALQQQTRAAGTSTSAGQLVPGLLAD